ncbi:MAG: hypothetical protein IPO91_03275 [Chloroflexi bacterium]|nr:hypothetical protein [Chloroflexota bacterium]
MDIAQLWRTTFMNTLRDPDVASALRSATLRGDWTAAMTAAVVRTCEAVDWRASAKGHVLKLQPIEHGEYLALDVIAFKPSQGRWHFPLAVFELENGSDDRIAYSLWKVLCVQAALRVVIAYRQHEQEIPTLVRFLREDVLAPLSNAERQQFGGETLLIIGNREAVDAFPSGFFKWWRLNMQLGQIELFR